MAVRIASSRWRAVQRAPIKPATFTQAMSSAAATAPRTSHSGRRASAVTAAINGVATAYGVNLRPLVIGLGECRELGLGRLDGDSGRPSNDDRVVELTPRAAQLVRPGERPEELEGIVDAIRHR